MPKLTLTYSGDRDGFSGKAFRSECDNKGATLTVIRSGKYIFGGFNSQSWTSALGYSDHNGCWLFSLTSPTGLLTKMENLSDECAMYNDASCGPIFGAGHDLSIVDEMRSTKNSSKPYSYSVAPGFSGTEFTEKTFAGSRKFRVNAIEVFSCA